MKVVSTANAPAAIGPYSQALDLGNMVFVSGQIPVDPATGTMADTVEQQAAQSLANLKAILAEAGLSMNNVVKTVIFLADINDFAAVNAEYAKAFAEPFPARSCVQVAAIPKGAKLEIECIAVRDWAKNKTRKAGHRSICGCFGVPFFGIMFGKPVFTSAHRPRIAR